MNKKHILKKNADFQRIISKKKGYKFDCFIIYVENIKENNYYFGFSVGKKIGNAVTRNKIKRQLKNIVAKKDYQNNFNCIIIVNRNILNKSYEEKEKALLKILNDLNLVKEKINEQN